MQKYCVDNRKEKEMTTNKLLNKEKKGNKLESTVEKLVV